MDIAELDFEAGRFTKLSQDRAHSTMALVLFAWDLRRLLPRCCDNYIVCRSILEERPSLSSLFSFLLCNSCCFPTCALCILHKLIAHTLQNTKTCFPYFVVLERGRSL